MLLTACVGVPMGSRADDGPQSLPADSLRTTDIEEVVVVSTPKENQWLRQQALSSSSFSQDMMRERGIDGLKDLSAQVPNLFIPSYGSRLTTSVYVRGVGSRTGTPAVTLYVDGVPQLTPAGFDFNFAGVDRIDVLRGPQGTLYGRGSMGGVIRVFTKNPMHYQGTDIQLEAGQTAGSTPLDRQDGDGAGHYRLNLTHYHRISDHFAFSGHLFGEYDGGFFRNGGRDNELIDTQTDLGARMRFIYQPRTDWHFDLTLSHEWLRQGGYPYEYRGVVGAPTTPDPETPVGTIGYDNRSGYRRQLTNAGLTVEKTWPKLVLTSVSGFQRLDDQMDLDQDFTTTNLYTLIQRQHIHTLSEEIILKNAPSSADDTRSSNRYAWLLGGSVFHSWARTEGPVTFHDDGLGWLNGLVNRQANTHLPTIVSHDEQGAEAYRMNFLFDNLIEGSTLGFPGVYKTPTTNAALFHQSTLSDLFGVQGLCLTAGLRVDYEHFRLNYDAHYGFGQRYGLNGRLTYPDGSVREGMTLVPTRHFEVADGLLGECSKDYLQLLPRVTLQWMLPASQTFGERSSVYATVSRGHRSGGYNMQMFSDLLQTRMQTAIMKNVADATVPVVEAVAMIPPDVRDKVRDMLIGMGTQQELNVQEATWYKPESSWNYEVGAHLNLLEQRLQADVAAFWMQTRDQQVSKMSSGGLGRVTVNSGESRSIGAEAALRLHLADGWLLQAAYGYTHARFCDDSRDTFVPFVPRHTLTAGITREWMLPHRYQSWPEAIVVHVDYKGAGRIYWTESNSAWQDFAGTLNARLAVKQKDSELAFYVHNLLATHFQTFYFETMQRGFAQYTRPAELGFQLRWRF